MFLPTPPIRRRQARSRGAAIPFLFLSVLSFLISFVRNYSCCNVPPPRARWMGNLEGVYLVMIYHSRIRVLNKQKIIMPAVCSAIFHAVSGSLLVR